MVLRARLVLAYCPALNLSVQTDKATEMAADMSKEMEGEIEDMEDEMEAMEEEMEGMEEELAEAKRQASCQSMGAH